MKDKRLENLIAKLSEHILPETLTHMREAVKDEITDLGQLYQALEMSNRYLDVYRVDGYEYVESHIHSHHFFQIIYCRNYYPAEYLIGSKRYSLHSGDIFFIPPGTNHALLLPDKTEEEFKGIAIWLSLAFYNDMRARFPDLGAYQDLSPFLIRTKGTIWESLDSHLQLMLSESEYQAPGWEAVVLGLAVVLLTNLFRAAGDAEASVIPTAGQELLDGILAYIEKNLGSKLTMDDLAGRFLTSRSTINKLFQARMGMSFHTYITECRLEKAKNLILENLPLDQISTKVGFTDYSAFYRAFKKKFGVSPKEYKLLYESNLQ